LHRFRLAARLLGRFHLTIPIANHLETQDIDIKKGDYFPRIHTRSFVSHQTLLFGKFMLISHSSATLVGLLRLDCLIPLLHYDESNFTLSAWIGVLFQVLENASGIICSCLPTLAQLIGKLGDGRVATILRSLLTRSSHSGSRNSGRTHDETPNATIGKWRTRKIKKPSTLAVTTYEGSSLDNLAEERPGTFEIQSTISEEIELNRIKKVDTQN
jgi:hypothetical protein